jgi:PTH2 family peptidyl-tRNA hydrolase
MPDTSPAISGNPEGERRTKQVIVMRKDLNMRKGKMVAQGAHASLMWLSLAIAHRPEDDCEDSLMLRPMTMAAEEWLTGRFTKVCVGVDSEEELRAVIEKARSLDVNVNECVDAGLTEFGGVPTLTCCAVGPDWNERVDAVTGDLKPL